MVEGSPAGNDLLQLGRDSVHQLLHCCLPGQHLQGPSIGAHKAHVGGGLPHRDVHQRCHMLGCDLAKLWTHRLLSAIGAHNV